MASDPSPRLWKRAIIHVDMDAFFASVELKDDPELAGKPVVVGGVPESRGVVAAASYEARAFGIHSAMPMARAVRLCPDLLIRPPRFGRYEEESQAVRQIFDRYTPVVEPLSLDEAFLDVTGSQRLHGPAPEIGRRIQQSIRRERQLSASVGVAACKFIAKLASDLEKPGGLVVVQPGTEKAFLQPLPVGRMWGVGPVTERVLQGLGLRTIGDLQRLEPEALRADLGALAEPLIELAHGRDESPVKPTGESKSLSAETTFAEDLADLGELERQLLALAERVAERLRAEDLACRTVTLKVRLTDFRTLTRSTTLNEPTHSTEEIHAVACALLREKAFVKERAVRLLGIATSRLCRHADRQLDLFAPEAEGQRHRLDHVLDQLRRRLGDEAVHRARLLTRPPRPRPSHSKDKG